MQLPFDLKGYRADRQLMRRILVALSVTAAVMLFATGSRMVAEPSKPTEPAIDYKQIAAERTGDVVWLMRGEPYRLTWTDPHTGMNRILVCEVHETGFITAEVKP